MNTHKTRNKHDYQFGQIAIRRDLVTLEQVMECMAFQEALFHADKEIKPLSIILLEKGYITPDDAGKIEQATQYQVDLETISIPGHVLIDVLGRGSMGMVYKARQTSMNRMVAIKVLHRDVAREKEYIDRFMREARSMARLRHENIVSAYDAGESQGNYFIVMEYIEGSTVKEILKREKTLETRYALNIAFHIAKALDHSHQHSMVHRDIKPSNIIVTPDNVAKLCDLGLAKQALIDPHLTMTGTTVGTPDYMSPEQASGEPDIDIRSDIYSLGTTLFQMVTGALPFDGVGSTTMILKSRIEQQPRPPISIIPELDPQVNLIILKMIEKDRRRRYRNPSTLIADLQKCL